jgi:hypothetical protein
MIAALLLAVAPVSIPQAVVQKIEICRDGLRHWDAGDAEWMEREMERRGLDGEAKQRQRVVCLVYLQGAVDVVNSLPAQGRGEAPGARPHEQAIQGPSPRRN